VTIEMSVIQAGTQLAWLPGAGPAKCASPPHPPSSPGRAWEGVPALPVVKETKSFSIRHMSNACDWSLFLCGLGMAWPVSTDLEHCFS
jgi:hypothetical protein